MHVQQEHCRDLSHLGETAAGQPRREDVCLDQGERIRAQGLATV